MTIDQSLAKRQKAAQLNRRSLATESLHRMALKPHGAQRHPHNSSSVQFSGASRGQYSSHQVTPGISGKTIDGDGQEEEAEMEQYSNIMDFVDVRSALLRLDRKYRTLYVKLEEDYLDLIEYR